MIGPRLGHDNVVDDQEGCVLGSSAICNLNVLSVYLRPSPSLRRTVC
jgi:hypothetical protein